MDKLLLHVIKLEKIINLKEGIKTVKYIGDNGTLVDSIEYAFVFDKNVDDELPILMLKYSTWDIINIYKYILSDDFTVFKVQYPYAIRRELKERNLLKANDSKIITNVHQKDASLDELNKSKE